jgi:nitroreductase
MRSALDGWRSADGLSRKSRGKRALMADSRPNGSGTQAALAAYLKTRRTVPAAQMRAPGPDAETLAAMLTIAARVPDHGKLAPWRFVVFDAARRAEAVAGLLRIAERTVDEKERRRRAEKANGFADAPLIVAVVSSPVGDHPKIPLWEQQMSAGAVCLNLLHAAWAHGFAAQWLTGWYAYDEDAVRFLGLCAGERLAGFVHIGTPAAPPSERERPDVAAITSHWSAARA